MSKETEKTFRELQKFLDGQEIGSDAEVEAAINVFLKSRGIDPPPDAEPDAWDYLDMAQEARTQRDAVKYAKKALELDPGMIEAELILVSDKAKSAEDFQTELERLLEKAEGQLKEQGITREQDAGEYYGMVETRPYLRIYHTYLSVLTAQGKYRKAAEVCRDILYLNEGDNLGVRYDLMALYAALEEKEAMEALYQEYSEEGSFMLLPLIALYYKIEDEKSALKYIRLLCSRNKEVKKGLRLLNSQDDDQIDEITEAAFYSPFSMQELVLAYCNSGFLYGAIPNYVPWMLNHLPPGKKSSSGKVVEYKKKG